MELSQRLPRARDSEAYWNHAVQVFSRNEKDIPFAMFYSTELDNNSADSTNSDASANSQYQCTLRRSIGLLEPVSTDLSRFDLRQSHGIIKLFKQAIIADTPTIIDLAKTPEGLQLIEGVPPRSSGEAYRSVVICPLHPPSSKETLLGFMVLGLSSWSTQIRMRR